MRETNLLHLVEHVDVAVDVAYSQIQVEIANVISVISIVFVNGGL